MNYTIHNLRSKELYGLPVELTTSHNENYAIIHDQWKKFNHELRVRGIKYVGDEWEKFGITMRRNGKLWYIPSIPVPDIEGFKKVIMPAGYYATFVHVGSMTSLKVSINTIYMEVIPNELNVYETRDILHIERYDKRFRWNRDDSVIEVIVPICGKRVD